MTWLLSDWLKNQIEAHIMNLENWVKKGFVLTDDQKRRLRELAK